MKKQKAIQVNGIKLDVLVVKVPEGPIPGPWSPKPWMAFCLTPVPTTRRHTLGMYFGRIEYAESANLEAIPPIQGSTEEEVLLSLRQRVAERLSAFEEVKRVEIEATSEYKAEEPFKGLQLSSKKK